MPDITLKTQIQLRNDIEQNWNIVADTLIPLAGEPCVTNDGEHKGQIKIGDGVLTWGELPYLETGEKNIIDCVKTGGVPLPVQNKCIDIPLATLSALGVVRSSNKENKVNVSANGEMEINSVNVNKLSQNQGDVLVLDSGDSNNK